MVGPGKPIDSERWFVVCVNALGGSCKGSTGRRRSIPRPAARIGSISPELSIGDGADSPRPRWCACARHRTPRLRHQQLDGRDDVARAARAAPGIARSHINISGAARTVAVLHRDPLAAARAIRLDPKWNRRRLRRRDYPESGMRMARKLGVITYRSALGGTAASAACGSRTNAGRRSVRPGVPRSKATSKATRAASCAASTRTATSTSAVRWTGSRPRRRPRRRRARRPRRVGSTRPRHRRAHRHPVPAAAAGIAEACAAGGADRFPALPSPQGHDAFLVDIERFGPAVAGFLNALPAAAA